MRARARFGAVITLALVSEVGWTNLAHADCSKDTDCKGDRICVQGECAVLAAPETPAAPPQPPRYQIAPPGTALYYPVMIAPAWHYSNPTLRQVGVGLFIAGTVLVVGGTIAYAVGTSLGPAQGSAFDFSNNVCQPVTETCNMATGNGASPTEAYGELFWIIGGVVTATGITLWAVGGSVVPGPEPAQTSLLHGVVPYVFPTKGGARAGLSMAF